ncbi:DUF881 domain-containing protein [Bacillus massilinigeriensis]|uniref:DUF881 domain-containing protein n=1 Tax=Bacillus massilionigeriensis TaxID=1805475 RepID=UPI00096B3EA2|nr:DUF881 domain-containing protein [Bacillus massilionigeriensis]
MDKKKTLNLFIIAIVIGFMIAIQFQTVQKPVVRDTRDTWQLREDLASAKELQSELLLEITSNEEKLAMYETERKQSKEAALIDTIKELKKEAGLEEVNGPGITLIIKPAYEDLLLNHTKAVISPDLLKRLINEMNIYDAKEISIDGKRIINTTVIRDINGEAKIDGHSLNHFPIEIKVVTDDYQNAEKLYNQMKVSKIAEEFFIDSLKISVLEPEAKITLPGYQDTIRIQKMEPVKQ